MKRFLKRRIMMAIGMCVGLLSSCTSGLLIPTRDAAVDGLSGFVTQTVSDVLEQWIDIGDPDV
jgi:hypothetical protein